MTFTKSIKTVFQKYATFSGRASRSEFWWFMLLCSIVSILFNSLIGTYENVYNGDSGYYIECFRAAPLWLSALFGLWSLLIIIPALAVSVRRLHDTGHGGGWIFITFVPLIGSIWYLVLMVKRGQYGPNRFGPDPLDVPKF